MHFFGEGAKLVSMSLTIYSRNKKFTSSSTTPHTSSQSKWTITKFAYQMDNKKLIYAFQISIIIWYAQNLKRLYLREISLDNCLRI